MSLGCVSAGEVWSALQDEESVWIAPRSPAFFEVSAVVPRQTDLPLIVGHRSLHHHDASVDVLDQKSVVANEARDVLDIGTLVTVGASPTSVEGGPVVNVGV